MMNVTVSVVCMFSLLGSAASRGQTFPTKPMRVISSEPGGGADLVARVVAQGLSATLGQQAVVDNRGGSVVIQAENLTKAPPDGHTVLVTGNTIWLFPLLQAKSPYDAATDLLPVTMTTFSPAVLAVHPSLPAKSLRELIDLAKSRPGELNYASGALGSTTHLSSELLKSMSRIDIARIPYKGAGPALNALVAGQVHSMFITASSVMPHVKSGRLRALAVASAEATALAPGLPTMAAAGLPGYESVTMHAVFAPAKTPRALVTRLNQEIVQYINRSDVKEKLFSSGLDLIGATPERAAQIIQSEVTRMGKVIKDAGIVGE